MQNIEIGELCRRIVASTPDAMIVADRDGVVRLWNGGAEALFGFDAAEAVGQSLDLIIPERLQPRHWEGFHRVMETGVTKYGREMLSVPAVRKDGARISLEFSVALLRDDAGELQGITAILRDVTARFERDRELRQRLTALEAQLAQLDAPGRE
jgi:PAS domain S-box-containing protein